jgi:hypothetical protein
MALRTEVVKPSVAELVWELERSVRRMKALASALAIAGEPSLADECDEWVIEFKEVLADITGMDGA